MEVKTEADDVTECLRDDQLTTGLSGLCGFSLYVFFVICYLSLFALICLFVFAFSALA